MWIKCDYCKTEFFRKNKRINEAIKNNWKQYCSLKCQSLAKTKKKKLICNNPTCNKSFEKIPSTISSSGDNYCSSKCAITINNSKFPKRKAKLKECPVCKKQYKGRNKFCSRLCFIKAEKNRILQDIKIFYQKFDRIPFKKEYKHYKKTRTYFKTWNNAIKIAGFKPNPVKFAKKYIANDGHMCDSLSEKIIDDWLYSRKIKHKINVNYPKDKNLTADFVVDKYWIEFFGLDGELKTYDKLKKRKIKVAKEKKLNLISIYPKDLFPKNRLNQVLGFLILT